MKAVQVYGGMQTIWQGHGAPMHTGACRMRRLSAGFPAGATVENVGRHRRACALPARAAAGAGRAAGIPLLPMGSAFKQR